MDGGDCLSQTHKSLSEGCNILEQGLNRSGSERLVPDGNVLVQKTGSCVQDVILDQVMHKDEYPSHEINLSLTHGEKATFVRNQEKNYWATHSYRSEKLPVVCDRGKDITQLLK